MNLQESIRRILREEVNESTFFIRRVDMGLINKEFFENLNLITSLYLRKYIDGIDFNFETFEDHVIHYFMDSYYNDLTNGGENDYPVDEVYEFLLNHFHKKIKDRYDTFFGRNINESEDDEEKKIQKNLIVIRKLISMFDYSEVCDMWVEYNYEDGDYEIKSKMSTKNHNTAALEKEFEFLENSIESLGFTNCYVFRPWYVENCEDEVKFMNESEDKKGK